MKKKIGRQKAEVDNEYKIDYLLFIKMATRKSKANAKAIATTSVRKQVLLEPNKEDMEHPKDLKTLYPNGTPSNLQKVSNQYP